MSSNQTFTMIKPTVVKNNKIGEVLTIIEQNGFRVVAMKKLQLTSAQAEQFYNIHKEKPFFGELIEYMISGPIIAIILEKGNAVADYRELIGSTDPNKAEEGTIRKKYATSVTQNAVHGADSDENAAIESQFFFANLERF